MGEEKIREIGFDGGLYSVGNGVSEIKKLLRSGEMANVEYFQVIDNWGLLEADIWRPTYIKYFKEAK